MSEKPVFDRDHAPGAPELAPKRLDYYLVVRRRIGAASGRPLGGSRRVLSSGAGHPAGSFDSLHLLGVIFWQRGHHAEAVRRIDLALKLNPSHSPALNNRGNALMALRRFEEALTSYELALALQPDYAEAHCNRGNALQELRRFEDALASYDHALTLRPDYAEVYYNRGNVLTALKRFDEALTSYDRALALQPGFVEALSIVATRCTS